MVFAFVKNIGTPGKVDMAMNKSRTGQPVWRGDGMRGMKQFWLLVGIVLGTVVAVGLSSIVSQAQGTGRITDGLVVLYGFEDGAGATVADVSGVGTPMNLTIADENTISWLPG